MTEQRLLVVTHPVLGIIGREEIEHAVPQPHLGGGWDHVEIAPLRASHEELHGVDWEASKSAQEKLFTEHLKSEVVARKRLAYFGLAPIPLALHFGYLVGRITKVDVYQRHHVREDWVWTRERSAPGGPVLRPPNLPDYGSTDAGPVVIRVSTTQRVTQTDTLEIVPNPLAQVDVTLSTPGEDALETRGDLIEVVSAFSNALARINGLFPNLTNIHLFTAVPVGLAFRMGTQINPTIYRDVVTYQYWGKGTPKYRKAIVLAESGVSASSRGEVPVPDLRWSFLEDPSYDWKKPSAVEFHEIMVLAYSDAPRAKRILSRAGADVSRINFTQAPRELWAEALGVVAAAGGMRTLAQFTYIDPDVNGFRSRFDRLSDM